MRWSLLLIGACGSAPAPAPVANRIAAPEAPAPSACPNVVSNITYGNQPLPLARAFPQCPPEPFEYAYWVCGETCATPCRVDRDEAVVKVPEPTMHWDGRTLRAIQTDFERVDFVYDAGRAVRIDFRIAAHNQPGQVFEQIALIYDDHGKLVREDRVRDMARHTVTSTTYRYDDAGRVTESRSEDELARVTYSRTGQLVKVESLFYNAVGDDHEPTTRTMELDYDPAGRLVTERTSWTGHFAEPTTTRYAYDCP